MRFGPAHFQRGAFEHPFVIATVAWVLAALALGAWTLHAGKDLSWDVLNHQLYLPYSLTSGRYSLDLLAAGPQSTQHPLGYFPFWGMVAAEWPAWCIGLVFVFAHAAVAVPLARISLALWPAPLAGRHWWWLLALALALLAPSLLLVAGTSSSDPLGAVLVLWALAASVPGRRSARDALVAGALLGLAVVIKPSNVVFAIAVFAAWIARLEHWRGAITLAGSAAVFASALQAPWSWWLQREFASPLYPLFNSVFQSPYAPLEAMLSDRYMPSGAFDWVSRPFVLAQPRRLTHTEALAPDLRPGLCALAMLALAIATTLRSFRRHADEQATSVPAPDRELWVFAIVSYGLWMLTSGNSRYALPLFIVAGLLATRGLQRALPSSVARVVLGLAVLLQGAYYFELGTRRFDTPVAWDSGPYVDVQIPERLRRDPALHLSLGTPSFAALAPWLAQSGGFVNAIGTMSVPTVGPLGAKLAERLSAFDGRTRVLFKGRPPIADNERAAQARAGHDRSIYRFGLKVDWRDCETLFIRTPFAAVTPAPAIALSSCAAQPRGPDDPAYASELAQAERVFAAIEASCPRVFGPTPMVTNAAVGAWHRHYMSSDARLMVSAVDGVVLSHFSVLRAINLGTMDEVLRGRGVAPCAAWASLTSP